MSKKIIHITVNLTEEEGQLLNKIAEATQRKPAELCRLLLIRSAVELWADIQAKQNPENRPAFRIPLFIED